MQLHPNTPHTQLKLTSHHPQVITPLDLSELQKKNEPQKMLTVVTDYSSDMKHCLS